MANEEKEIEPVLTGTAFADAVQRVVVCATRKGPFEQTSLIHLKAVGNKLGFRACDLNQEASVGIPYDGQSFETSVNGELLARLAPAFINDELFSIEIPPKDGEIILRGESSMIRVPATKEVKPPEFPRPTPDHTFSIQGNRLSEAIAGVSYALDGEENIALPALNGICMRSKDRMTLTASSQRSSIERVIETEGESKPIDVILPLFAANYLVGNFSETPILLCFGKNQMTAKCGTLEYRSVLIDAKYPDTVSLFAKIAEQTNEAILVNRKEMLRAIMALIPLYPRIDKLFNPMMRLEVTTAHCRLSTDIGEGSYVSLHGYREAETPVTLYISGTQMQDMFKHLKSNMVVIRFGRDEKLPMLMEPPEGEHDAGKVRAFLSAKARV